MGLRFQRFDDARLAALVHAGDEAAFEALYDRHHAALLSFCRHMCGNLHDGEDALQQTFLRAHRSLAGPGGPPDSVKAWLFAIARNRCLTIIAARRADAVPVEEVELAYEGLVDDVRRRADLRELVSDLARLPDDQRGALVMFELGGLSQTEIADALECPPGKVKALVFQARTTLIAERDARDMPCTSIREQLSVATGGALRRGPLRRHLRMCEGCRAYQVAVAGQRTGLASILPVTPSVGLKAAALAAAGLSGGGAGAGAGGAVFGGAAINSLAAKVAAAVVIGGGVTAGVVAGERRASEHSAPTRVSAVASATAVATPTPTPAARRTVSERRGSVRTAPRTTPAPRPSASPRAVASTPTPAATVAATATATPETHAQTAAATITPTPTATSAPPRHRARNQIEDTGESVTSAPHPPRPPRNRRPRAPRSTPTPGAAPAATPTSTPPQRRRRRQRAAPAPTAIPTAAPTAAATPVPTETAAPAATPVAPRPTPRPAPSPTATP